MLHVSVHDKPKQQGDISSREAMTTKVMSGNREMPYKIQECDKGLVSKKRKSFWSKRIDQMGVYVP